MASDRGRWCSKRDKGDLHVTAMCPDQGSAIQFGAEKMGKRSTRLEALRGSRKQHESKTLTTTIRLRVRCYSFYILVQTSIRRDEERLSAPKSR